MNKNILIIGGSGYIGAQLVDFMKDNDHGNSLKITVIDTENYNENVIKRNDINYINGKYQDLPETFFSEFTDIVLLAGQGSVSNSKSILNIIDNNIRNFAWLTELLNKEQKLIYASSSSVYGRTDNKDVSEEFYGYEPYNYYDWSKQNIDQICELKRDNLQFYGLRFGTVNGFSRNLRNDVMINSMCYNAKNNGKIFVSKNNVNRPILGISDLCNSILTIIYNGSIEKSGVYNLHSFNMGLFEIAKKVAEINNVECEELTSEKIVNFKLQTKSYDFKIDSTKFIETFDFTFKDTLESITHDLLSNWDKIQNFQNRLDDKFINYKIIKNCRVCNNKTKSLLNLGNQPLANNYTKFSNTLDYNPVHLNIEHTFPLHLHYCEECFHVQLNCVVNPDILFKNYLYVSGTSNTLKKYFEEFALNSIFTWKKYNKSDKDLNILDIASNDCSQLDAYNKIDTNFKINTVGVDPSVNIYKNISCKKTEHDVYCDFFNPDIVNKLKLKYDKFDIIVCQNVFGHVNDVNQFLNCTFDLISDTGIILIQTSQKNMILENKADTGYHEHLSFFNTNSMKILCEKNGLFLNNVYEHSIHGISYIFEISKQKCENSNVMTTLQNEINYGLYDKLTYKNYGLKCIRYKNELHNKLIDYKLLDKNIIGVGATAKSSTVLNFAKIDNNIIDYIIDENKLKQNLYTAGSNILISDFSALKDINKNTIILIIAWNFYEEILQKIKNKLIEFNIHFPVEVLNIDTLETLIINI